MFEVTSRICERMAACLCFLSRKSLKRIGWIFMKIFTQRREVASSRFGFGAGADFGFISDVLARLDAQTKAWRNRVKTFDRAKVLGARS
jgi:hypothetical protein